MVNTIRKGATAERKAIKELEKEGYNILFRATRTKFGGNDFADLFDIIGARGRWWVFVSVKCGKPGEHFKKHQAKIKEFCHVYAFPLLNEFRLYIWRPPHWAGRGKHRKWKNAGFEIKTIQ